MQSVQAEYIYILLTFFVPRLVYDVIGQDNLLSPHLDRSATTAGFIIFHVWAAFTIQSLVKCGTPSIYLFQGKTFYSKKFRNPQSSITIYK